MNIQNYIGKIATPTSEAVKFFEKATNDLKLPTGKVVDAREEFGQILVKIGPDQYWRAVEYFTFRSKYEFLPEAKIAADQLDATITHVFKCPINGFWGRSKSSHFKLDEDQIKTIVESKVSVPLRNHPSIK